MIRLVDGLGRRGIRLDPRPGGTARDGEVEYGSVNALRTGEGIVFTSRPITWGVSPEVAVRLRFEAKGAYTVASLEVDGGPAALGPRPDDFADWTAGTLLPSVLQALSPSGIGDWVTDRSARRPTGPAAIETYRDPTYHWPNFLLILDRLRLTASDRLLEVACGGGAFLHNALESGCQAIGVDHSPDMVRTTREENRPAIEEGRLEVRLGEADELPVPDGAFTACVWTGAFDFFPDPVRALGEMHRALSPGGRLAIHGSTAELRGTPAAPEPIASRVHFYDPAEIRELACRAGFTGVRTESPDMAPFAKAAGLRDELVDFFRGGSGAYLLLAEEPGPGSSR